MARSTESYEYIVVGGGSAGCVVAGRLAEAGRRVLLLEAGPRDKGLDLMVPAAGMIAYKTKNWRYMPEPDASRYGVVESWPGGKVLGGSGSINGMVYVRGNPLDFDRWAEMGCKGWTYDDVLPHFKRLESWEDGENQYRGGSGPINVCTPFYEDDLNRAFRQAAVGAGYPENSDYNAGLQYGVSRVQMNTKRGLRSQSSRGYLRKVARRECLTVKTDAHVSRIIFSGRRATGVEYVSQGATHVASTDGEVILSSGALASPKILQLSGVGPAAQLERYGIDVVHANEAVGRNLQEHSSVMLRWNSSLPNANNVGVRSGLRALKDLIMRGGGLLSTTVFQDQIFCHSDGASGIPDLQITFANFALSREPLPGDGMMSVAPSKATGVMLSVNAIHPKSRGEVRLRSANPQDQIVLDYSLFGERDDVDVLRKGCDMTIDVMNRPEFGDMLGPMFDPEAQCRTRDEWDEFILRNSYYTAHPVGTCRMGEGEGTVVDSELRVHGIEGLRVADASIMPTETSGNTNCPSMMIGEKAAALILG